MSSSTPDTTAVSEPQFERWLWFVMMSWLACIQVSIAASQILLTAVALISVANSLKTKQFFWPPKALLIAISLFVGVSLLSAVFSPAPARSLLESKELLLLIIPVVVIGTRPSAKTLEQMILLLLIVSIVSACIGLWQFSAGQLSDIHHRIRGLVGHYMTYSGLLMSTGVVALAGWLFAPRLKAFYAIAFVLLSATLLLTLTRSAWLGMLVATILLLLIRDRRLLLALPVVLALALVAQPDAVRHRLGTFIQPDVSGLDRIAMLRTGSRMISTHPWLGVGTDMVAPLYPIYVSPSSHIKENPHLHNNALQLAAERGLLGLTAWLGMLLLLVAQAVRLFRHGEAPLARFLAAGALGVWVAGFVAGIFEYNFGDSEYQMLFLFILSVPFALETGFSRKPA